MALLQRQSENASGTSSPRETSRVTTTHHDRATPEPYPYSRYSDRPIPWQTRVTGLAGTASVFAAILACALVTWRVAQPPPPTPQPLMLNLLPLAAPPEPAQYVPEGKPQPEQRKQKPVDQQSPLLPEAILPLPAQPAPQPSPVPETAAPAKTTTEASAPKTTVAPPAPRASNSAAATWEAQLLAHLEKFRRYPAAARARKQQGVTHVRFRMNRAGAVLTAEVIRSSGVTLLDRAAIDTIRRAAPLPPIPEGRPETMELSVPVEFFVRR